MAVPPDVIGGETITSEWGNDIRDWAVFGEVDGSVEVAGPVNLTTPGTDAATVSLLIPAGWGSWKCEAYATFSVPGSSGGISFAILIDGVAQQSASISDPTLQIQCAIGGRRAGMTGTGSRPIVLRGALAGGIMNTIYLYARAVRTS